MSLDQVKLINLSRKSDNRGSLIPVESHKEIPFQIQRVFFLKDLSTIPRGNHSNQKTDEVLIPISGSFQVELTTPSGSQTYQLQEDTQGIYIPKNIWIKMSEFSQSPPCIIAVLCSELHDPDESIRNFQDYLSAPSTPPVPAPPVPAPPVPAPPVPAPAPVPSPINCFNLQGQTQQLKPQLMETFERILDTNHFVLGPELEQFEANFAKYIGTQHCVGVSNGTSALIAALKALQLPPHSEIYIQSNTYIAAPLAIKEAGHAINVVEVTEDQMIDLDDLENKLFKTTKNPHLSPPRALIVVHLYGMCPDMTRLLQITQKYNLYLIEDTAQAHGSTFNDQKLGSFGDIGCFSFYPSKNLGSCGEGGCITTNSEKFATYIRKRRNYGGLKKYDHQMKGLNDRLHNLQAALLDVKLPHLDAWSQKKLKLAQLYDQLLTTGSVSPDGRSLSTGSVFLKLLPNHPKLNRAYHLYVILVQAHHRTPLLEYLQNHQINCGIHYPETFYKTPAFKEYRYLNTKADEYKEQLLSLPMYPELTEAEVRRVCQKIQDYFQEQS